MVSRQSYFYVIFNVYISVIKKFGDECPQDPGAFTHFQFTSARVGDYKCVSALNKLRVYKNGLVFSIPHSAQGIFTKPKEFL